MIRMTTSLCPECYQFIPASIAEQGSSIWMEKKCPVHGWFRAMVERDPFWFWMCSRFNCKNIYDGYLMDITDRCNLKCKYCYHKCGGSDYDMDGIIADAKAHKNLEPFSLIGGEPTLHENFPELYRRMCEVGKTTIVTNGVKLCDDSFFKECCKCGLLEGYTLNVGLSFHKESNGKDIEFLEKCRSLKLKLISAFWVIDNVVQIDEAVETYAKYRDVITGLRIKAASNLGNEKGAHNKIFTSDMLNYLKDKGRTDLIVNHDPRQYISNKVSIASVIFEGLSLLLVSWYDRFNVDLNDINCGPWYKAKNGTVYNLATSLLLNEKHYADARQKSECV